VCTGKKPTRRGLTSRSLTVSGASRTYLVYLPQAGDPNKPVPLVYVHHGYTMSGQAMVDITGYAALADQEGIAVVFPDGEAGPNALGAPWNVGSNVCGSGALATATGDDFDFLTAMRADVAKDQCVDGKHVFVTGFSMGGYFANQVGCMRPDLARAVAPHSGGTHDFGTCVAGHVPVILFHGTADNLIAESCGTQARDEWVAKNGCSTTTISQTVKNGHCEVSQGCPADGQVTLCLFDGLGHAWAGGAAGQSFSDPNYESATQLQWQFFKTYAW
jgi:polyhydroxybutyrate depolymerase